MMMGNFNTPVREPVCSAVKKQCDNNGTLYCYAVRVGLMAYLEADHEERIRLINKYREYGKSNL